MFAAPWFLTLLTASLPLSLACRVFDIFLLEVCCWYCSIIFLYLWINTLQYSSSLSVGVFASERWKENEERQALKLTLRQSWVLNVDDFIFLVLAYEDGWLVFSLAILSFQWRTEGGLWGRLAPGDTFKGGERHVPKGSRKKGEGNRKSKMLTVNDKKSHQ